MKIYYLGAYDLNYARNIVIRHGLEENGIEVGECQVSPRLNTRTRYKELWKKFRRIKDDISAIIVAEMNHSIMPLAYYFAKKKKAPLIFDPFISFYDSIIFDRGLINISSLKAKKYFWLDKISMKLADYLLSDTEEHKKYFISAFKIKKKIFVVPVGANEKIFYPRTAKKNQDFKVIFWGKFIPLHGIEYILKAAKVLETSPEIKIDLIGNGQTFNEMKSLAEKMKLKNIAFLGFVDINQLPVLMSMADICLGIFGNTSKAKRVIPNKVYCGIAMKKPVITGDSPAIREFFEHKKHVYLVPMADAEALAEGILELKENEDLREKIAENGYKIFQERFTSEKIGEMVKDILIKAIKK